MRMVVIYRWLVQEEKIGECLLTLLQVLAAILVARIARITRLSHSTASPRTVSASRKSSASTSRAMLPTSHQTSRSAYEAFTQIKLPQHAHQTFKNDAIDNEESLVANFTIALVRNWILKRLLRFFLYDTLNAVWVIGGTQYFSKVDFSPWIFF